MIELYEHQKSAIEKLRSGSILCGGVGSGKSRTALAYYFIKECSGKVNINGVGDFAPMKNPKNLYIITTARKRDTLEWEQECLPFLISKKQELSVCNVEFVVDSWNNINKYQHIRDAFFIFDEQRVVGSGSWVKSFLKICRSNNWVLLSATPGDTWMDYIPVFIANGFYKNRSEFIRRHVVYKPHAKFPKVDRYLETGRLRQLQNQVVVNMWFRRNIVAHDKTILTQFSKEQLDKVAIKRWNIYDDKPIKDVSQLCYLMRRIVNSDKSRLDAVRKLSEKHPRLIVFYNFDYELSLLLSLGAELEIEIAQWNGHKHEDIPDTGSWLYLVQYAAGAEAWNCIKTNAIIFYSQSYSYKLTVQAAGRIDRLNTPFTDLYYYYLRSNAAIDLAIQKALRNKQAFNEHRFLNAPKELDTNTRKVERITSQEIDVRAA